VAEIEQEKLQSFEVREVIGDDNVLVPTGQHHAFLTLDGPQRVRLGNRADRFNRFRDDPVDQGIDPDTFMGEIEDKARLHLPVASNRNHQIAQDFTVARHQLTRKDGNRVAACAITFVQQDSRLRRESTRRRVGREHGSRVFGEQRVAVVRRIGNDHLHLVPNQLAQRAPVLVGVERLRDTVAFDSQVNRLLAM
jgi:hypothetical protein